MCFVVKAFSAAFGDSDRAVHERMDKYHGPGWIMLAVQIINFGVLLVCLPARLAQPADALKQALLQDEPGTQQASRPRRCPKLDLTGVPGAMLAVLLLTFFAFSSGWSVTETMTTPLLQDQLGTDVKQTAVLYVISGLSNALTFAVIFLLDKRISSRQIVAFALIVGSLGFITLMDFQSLKGTDTCRAFSCSWNAGDCSNSTRFESECLDTPHCAWNQADCKDCPPVCYNPSHNIHKAQVYVGMVLINIAFAAGRVAVFAVYASLFSGQSRGFMMALLPACGSIARIVGPPAALAMYSAAGHHTISSMGAALAVFILSFVGILAVWGQLFYERSNNTPTALAPTQASGGNKYHVQQQNDGLSAVDI